MFKTKGQQQQSQEEQRAASCVQGATKVSTFLMGSEKARWEQGLELVFGVGLSSAF